jgi:hypothetical protein
MFPETVVRCSSTSPHRSDIASIMVDTSLFWVPNEERAMGARRHTKQPQAQVSLNRTCSGHQPHDTPSLMFQRMFQDATLEL